MYKTIKRIIKNHVSENNFLYRNFRMFRRKIQSLKRLKPLKRLQFDVHVVDHCNLNCMACQHFSPLVNGEWFIDIADFERDCIRLSELTDDIEYFSITGGEALLHPKIIDLLIIARKYFMRGKIVLNTNGILLLKQPDKFWEICRLNNIQIIITRYPISIDTDKIEKKTLEMGITLQYWPPDKMLRSMCKFPLDIHGRQDCKNNYTLCGAANGCIQLRQGRIYTCPVIAYIEYFNNFFGQNLKVAEKDYIDIYKVKNIDEVYSFLCKPMPFCRYCNIKKTVYGMGWTVSKKQITEWT